MNVPRQFEEHEPSGIAHRKHAEERLIDQRKDCRVRADAEPDGQERRQRESADPSAASESPAGRRAARLAIMPRLDANRLEKVYRRAGLRATILRRIPSTAIEDARSNTVGGSGTGLVVGVVKVTT